MKEVTARPAESDYLGIDNTTALEGLLALGILIAHMAPASGIFQGSILSPLLGSLGYLCVSVFFFLSGYGIMSQYMLKSEQYLKRFLKDRVLSIYLLIVFLVIVYGIFHPAVGNPYSLSKFLQSFAIGDTIVSNGWYLQVIVLFYFLWYLCVRYIEQAGAQLVVLCLAVLAYMVMGAYMLPSTWYECSACFLLGVFWKKYKNHIDGWLFANWKRQLAVLTVAFVAFVGLFVLASKRLLSGNSDEIFRLTTRCLSSPAFVVMILMINTYLSRTCLLNCAPLRFLGEISIEIYALQGILLQLFRSPINIQNGWMYMACVFVGTMLSAVVIHPAVRFIMNIPKRYL